MESCDGQEGIRSVLTTPFTVGCPSSVSLLTSPPSQRGLSLQAAWHQAGKAREAVGLGAIRSRDSESPEDLPLRRPAPTLCCLSATPGNVKPSAASGLAHLLGLPLP